MSEPLPQQTTLSLLKELSRKPRLTSFTVTNLFGTYSHQIELPLSDPFVIIFGPNGIGKTQIFRILNAIAKQSWAWLLQAPFDSVRLNYEDGKILEVLRIPLEDGSISLQMVLSLTAGEVLEHWSMSEEYEEAVREITERSHWRPSPVPTLWRDEQDGEVTTEGQLSDLHGWEIPTVSLPIALRNLIRSTDVRLIETQRLSLTDNEILGQGSMIRQSTSRLHPTLRPLSFTETTTVSKYSDFMKSELESLLALNSRVTQTLDRTFPSRLLAAEQEPVMDEETIRAAYSELNGRRRRLAEISLLESELDVPLPEDRLEDWQRLVLTTYLRDSEQKLEGFTQVVERINLLENIINSRFLGKRLSITVGDGLGISTKTGQYLTADQLSSGEQHELVLMFALLFTIPASSIVLIDEPEISLHISWQRRFMSDIEKIARLGQFRFIVATHSPAIIDKWREYSKSLAPGIDD